MATDAYIKFGESNDRGGPNNAPLPLIEGDSTDDAHYWWCELRACDFALKAAERKEGGDHNKREEKPRPTIERITIKKRPDWASTQLFTKCCEAAEATTKKSDDDKAKGRIDLVTVEVCRQGGKPGEKFPFLIVKYHGVRVVNFGIDLSGSELPSETITLEVEKLEYIYYQTDPETGGKTGKQGKATDMESFTESKSATGQPGTAAPPGSAGIPAGAPAGNGGSPAGGNGLPASTHSATDAAAGANFPGLRQGTGFGLLPD